MRFHSSAEECKVWYADSVCDDVPVVLGVEHECGRYGDCSSH